MAETQSTKKKKTMPQHTGLGPAVWILGGFALYLIALSIFFSIENEVPVVGEKNYIIARDASWAPFDFAGKAQAVTAFTDELLMAIADDQEIHIHINASSPASLFTGLTNESYDAIISARLPEGSLLNRFYISPSFFYFGPVIVAPIGSTIHSANQLRGKVVGITQSVEQAMQYLTNPDTHYISYPHLSDALVAMNNGAVQAVIGGRLLAENYVRSLYPDKFEIASDPLSNLGLRLFTRHDDEGVKLLHKFSQGLHRLKEDGTYEALLKKWSLASIQPHMENELSSSTH